MISVKQLQKDFIDFEKDNNLYELEIQGVPIWLLTRFNIFISLRDKLTLKSERYNITDREISLLLKNIFKIIKNILFKNPLIKNKKIDLLFINHPRRKLHKGLYFDIYTDSFLPQIKSDFLVIEPFQNLQHYTPTFSSPIYYFDFIEFPSRLISLLPNKKNSDIISNIDRLIKEKWGDFPYDFKKEFPILIKRYKYAFPRIKSMLKKLQPNKIILVVSYSFINQLICIIAKEMNIPVYEIQHGVVGDKHIAYNYQTNKQIATFPDFFLSWGDYWTKKAKMPISKNAVKIVGFPYLESFKKSNTLIKKHNSIIVISQLREDVALFAKKLALSLPEYSIIFKMHPAEYNIAHNKYKYLNSIKNIKIIADDKIPLYEYFSKSKYVVGVYSTALIEALVFETHVFILKYPGWELFEDIKPDKNITFIEDVESMVDVVNQNTNSVNNSNLNSYFQSGSILKMQIELQNIK